MANIEVLPFDMKEEWRTIDNLSGKARLTSLLKWWKRVIVRFPRLAHDIVKENHDFLLGMNSPEMAILLGGSPVYYIPEPISKEQENNDTALEKVRNIDTNAAKLAEAWILLRRGTIYQYKAEYSKAAGLYAKARTKCKDSHFEPVVLLAQGTCFNVQGDYDRGFSYIDEAKEKVEKFLLTNKTYPKEDEDILKWVRIEILFQYGVVNLSMGDTRSEAKIFIDEAIRLANQYNLARERFMAPLWMARIILTTKGDSDEALRYIKLAEDMPKQEKEAIDEMAFLYIASDRAWASRSKGEYDEAMEQYAIELDIRKRSDERINYLMDQQVSLFQGALKGIWECLHKTDNVDATELRVLGGEYEAILSESGEFIEADKPARLEACKNNILLVLRRVFTEMPHFAGYNTFHFEFIKDDQIARYGKNQEYFIKKSMYLVLLSLIKNQGRCLTKKEIEEYIKTRFGVTLKVKQINTYVSRFKNKILGPNNFLDCPRGSYALKPPKR